MKKGKVKFYNSEKGFGFITETGGGDLFFHINDCDGWEPTAGDQVTFKMGKNKKGPAAVNIVFVEE